MATPHPHLYLWNSDARNSVVTHPRPRSWLWGLNRRLSGSKPAECPASMLVWLLGALWQSHMEQDLTFLFTPPFLGVHVSVCVFVCVCLSLSLSLYLSVFVSLSLSLLKEPPRAWTLLS